MNEKFSHNEVTALRNELLKGGLDSWQAAELFQAFLAGRGYGVSHDAARHAASTIEATGCSIEAMKHELEKIALVM